MASKKTSSSEKLDALRTQCEQDLFSFGCYVNPNYVYGDAHKELAKFLMRPSRDQLVLYPRGHLKSHWLANYCAWRITQNPDITIGYVSATELLGVEQLSTIKAILESERYRMLWPNMINHDIGRRERWQQTSIKVDHPIRRKEGVRDATVHVFGINSNTTGLHFKELMFDDVVVEGNVETEEARSKVAAAHAHLSAAVLEPTGITKTVGTIWHPKDLYNTMLKTYEEIVDENDKLVRTPVYEVLQCGVEKNGVYLWPTTLRVDGKSFGYDEKIMARIRAKYVANGTLDQFYMQYYNDPNAIEVARLDKTKFRYYDQVHLKFQNTNVYFRNKKLRVAAALDFAFSLRKRADFTAISVVGIDEDKYRYVLDIDRFKTKDIQIYFDRVLALHTKWGFKTLRVEVTAAQVILCQYLKDRVRQEGLNLVIEEYRPNRNMGTKEERMQAVLDPLYQSGMILHFNGGYVHMLEEELLSPNPEHDDIKDTLALAMEILKPPPRSNDQPETLKTYRFNSRFGGVC